MAVKLQLACFERLGAPGWAALAEARDAAREHGLLVLADGKRGDVPVTAAAYAQALVGSTPGPVRRRARASGADAFTANPLLGRDSLEPLVEAAAAAGAGCFLLVSTSNPAPPTSRTSTPAARRCTSGWPSWSTTLGAGARGASAGCRWWAPWWAPPAPSASPGCGS